MSDLYILKYDDFLIINSGKHPYYDTSLNLVSAYATQRIIMTQSRYTLIVVEHIMEW